MKISKSCDSTSFGAIRVNIDNPLTVKVAEELTAGGMPREMLSAYVKKVTPENVQGLLGDNVAKDGNTYRLYLFPEESEKIADLFSSAVKAKGVFTDNYPLKFFKSYISKIQNGAKGLSIAQQRAYNKNALDLQHVKKFDILKYDINDNDSVSIMKHLSKASVDDKLLKEKLNEVAPDYTQRLTESFLCSDGKTYKLCIGENVGKKLLDALDFVKRVSSDGKSSKKAIRANLDLQNFIQANFLDKAKLISQHKFDTFQNATRKLNNLKESLITRVDS